MKISDFFSVSYLVKEPLTLGKAWHPLNEKNKKGIWTEGVGKIEQRKGPTLHCECDIIIQQGVEITPTKFNRNHSEHGKYV
mmetsp:Transcript_10441/g.11341  ORF Transcript_10441/g.11341 Transcript_10441/m.11341 type:complete len:81 (-) Transcript_10441:1733-1975(-)